MSTAARIVAVTGAHGSLARDVIPGLLAAGYQVHSIDRVLPDDLSPADTLGAPSSETWHRADITDAATLVPALEGAQALIHLGGIPLEDEWDSLSTNNIDGTHTVLEAARHVGVRRVVLASSIHAVGEHLVPVDPRLLSDPSKRLADDQRIPADVPCRPNTLYGVSKAAGEALGQYVADRHGLEVVCARIASRFPAPSDERMLSTWLSPADAVRMFLAAISGTLPSRFVRIWGVSDNQRGYLSLAEGQAIGFHPRDDAEAYAEPILGKSDSLPERNSWDFTLGGVFSSPEPPRMPPRAQPE